MKSFTLLTKPLVLFVLLFALGVGQMWAGNRRIYFDYSLVTMWDDYTNLSGGAGFACVHCWGGNEGAADYTMSVVEGKSYLACCDIDDGWTHMCFYRKGSDGTWWTKTFDYDNLGSKNYFKIKNDSEKDGGIDKYKWDSATRWVPGVCIDGLINVNNPHLQPFTFDDNDGTYEVTLSAHTTYQFCILDGSTRYTVDNNVWSGTIPGYTLGTTGYDIRLATAGAGTYKFEYNKSTHVMKVTYPTVNHPNIDYCYLYKFNDWTHHYLHIYDSESSIEGTTYPGTEIENYFEIGDDKYYYFAPGDYANCQPNDNNDSRKVNPAASTSAGLGKFQKYITDSWGWRTFTVRIQLNDLGAGTVVDPTYMDVAFNSDVLTDLTSIPVKNGYTFGGFYSGYDAVNEKVTGVQVIDDSGNWIASVSDYTDASKHWIHAGMSTTIYAKWTEDKHTVNVAVSPAGAGSVQVNSSNVSSVTGVGIATKSAEMTPIALAGWKFKEWQVTSNVQMDLVNYHSDYQQGTANKMKINATADEQTITAVFEPRYYLVGKIWDDSADGGMPGWDNYNKPFKVVTTSPVLDTCKLTLSTNKSFYIEVRDKVDGFSYGKSGGISLGDDASITFTDKDNKVLFYSNGGTNYTFKITAVDGSGRPTVSVERPHQMHFAHKRVDIDGNDHNDDLGGTLTATINGESAAHEQWFDYGSNVSWTATSETGYSLTWYTDNAYSNAMNPQPEASWSDPDITHDENIFAKFTEKSTTVTINTNNSAGGSITVGGSAFSWGGTKTAGVTTKRALVVTSNTGYNFTSWALSSIPDFELQDKAGDTDKEVTLAGLGGTNGSTGTLTANFTAKTYSVKLNNDHGGESSDDGTATATFDATSLSSITHAQFSGWTLLGYWNSDGNQVTDDSGNLLASVLNYTSASNEWKYDGDVNLWAHWSRSVTLDDNGDYDGTGLVTVTYKGTAGTPSAPTRTGYHVEAYYAEVGCTNKVMEANGTLVDYSGYVADGKWTRGEATTLYAKWAPDTYTVTLHNDHEGASSDDGTATATYDATSLSSITDAQFSGWTLLGYWNSSAVQVTDAEGNLKANVTGFTDGSGKWTKTDNADVWAHWTRTITLDDNVSQQHNGSVSVTYKGAAASHSAPHARAGYTVNGYYNDAACTTKVMNNDGTLVSSVSGYTDGSGNWTHKTAATLYAKWTSDHFIIYRTGDKSDDPRKLATDVESYAGGTISEAIEFRMKVRELDTWYTLCLPFTVSAVKVWEEEECAYYDLVPFYRTGGKYYTGDYIIRTPEQTTDFPIADFDNWYDPESADGYLPSANTPYIIQWHHSYFAEDGGRYISFFGESGQTIPASFSAGSAPSSDNVVNVHGNNSMQIGSVAGAYLLENDYGSSGAWLRAEDVSEARTILPFECYILVNSPTRARYRAIRPGMATTDTPTGLETIISDDQQANKILINGQIYIIRDNKIYTIYGMEVQQCNESYISS